MKLSRLGIQFLGSILFGSVAKVFKGVTSQILDVISNLAPLRVKFWIRTVAASKIAGDMFELKKPVTH